jgi:hypothetical protein
VAIDECGFTDDDVGGTGFNGDGIVTVADGGTLDEDVGSAVEEGVRDIQRSHWERRAELTECQNRHCETTMFSEGCHNDEPHGELTC